jgi:heptosyltransferase-2
MGDVVMAIPGLRRLAQRHADAGVDVWCPHRWAPILEMAELSAAVIPFRPGRAIRRTATWVRSSDYDAAYLFTPTFAAAAVAVLAAIPMRRGAPAALNKWLLTERAAASKNQHRIIAFMAVADPNWGGEPPPVPRVEVPERASELFDRLTLHRLERPLLGIVPGCSVPARRWPEGRFTALAGMLASDVGSVITFGSQGDAVLAARVAAGAGKLGIDLGGRTSLSVLAASLASCDLVVANDNGALQLAAAVGARTLAIFGSRSPETTAPPGSSGRQLWAASLECAPCGRNACGRRGQGSFLPESRDECLNLISVEAVAEAARGQLREVGAPRSV